MTDYQVGDAVTLQATFRNLSGANADPTTVSLKVRAPSGTVTTYTYAAEDITKAATGVYEYVLSIAAAGRYTYKWFGTGSVQVASADAVLIANASVFG